VLRSPPLSLSLEIPEGVPVLAEVASLSPTLYTPPRGTPLADEVRAGDNTSIAMPVSAPTNPSVPSVGENLLRAPR